MPDFGQTAPNPKQRRVLFGLIIAIVLVALVVAGWFVFANMNDGTSDVNNSSESTETETGIPAPREGFTTDGQRIDPNAPVINLDNVE